MAFLLVRSRLGPGSRLLGAPRLLRGLGLLAVFAGAFGLRRIGRRLADALANDCVLAHWFLLDRVAVVTFITPVGRNIKRNLR